MRKSLFTLAIGLGCLIGFSWQATAQNSVNDVIKEKKWQPIEHEQPTGIMLPPAATPSGPSPKAGSGGNNGGPGPRQANVLLNENFSNLQLPNDWLILDVDGLTENPVFGSQTIPPINGWGPIRFIVSGDTVNTFMSTSQYSPPGTADDWIITEPIELGPTGTFSLNWQMRAFTANPSNRYEVRVCTNCGFNKTINTGNVLTEFSNVVATVPSESSTVYSQRTANLTSFAGDSIRIAWRNNTTNGTLLFLTRISVNQVVANDVGVTDFERPTSSCSFGTAEEIDVTIRNYGSAAQTNVPLLATLDGDTIGTGTIASVAAGATATGTMTIDLSAGLPGETRSLQVFTDLAGDNVTINDTITSKPVVYVASTDVAANAYTMSFEDGESRLGWVVRDVDNNDVTWRYFSLPDQLAEPDDSVAAGYGQTAGGASTNNAANDYIFSTCFDFDSALTYDLEFEYAKDGGPQSSLAVMLATGPRLSDIVDTIFVNNTIIDNRIWFNPTVRFSPELPGIYHFGFYAYGPGPSTNYVFVDDIRVREVQGVDAGVQALLTPTPGGYNCGSTMQEFALRLVNTGLTDIDSAKVKLWVQGTTDTLFDTVALTSGVFDTITLPGTIDLSGFGNYTIVAAVTSDGDAFNQNDTLTSSIQVNAPVPAPFSEDFDGGVFDPTLIGFFGEDWDIYSDPAGVNGTKSALGFLSNSSTGFGDIDSAKLYTPKISGITANSQLKYSYRITSLTGYPNGAAYAMQPGDRILVEVSADCGPWVTLQTITDANHVTATTYETEFLDLSPYASAGFITIRFSAYHNETQTSTIAVDLDNIEVFDALQFDAALAIEADPSYINVPVRHATGTSYNFSATITNRGTDPVTNAKVVASGGNGRYLDSVTVPLALSQGNEFTIGLNNSLSFTAADTGVQDVTFTLTVNQADGDVTNNTVTFPINVTRSSYARTDLNATPDRFIGFFSGTANTGDPSMGQVYFTRSRDTIDKVRAYFGNITGNVDVSAEVFRRTSPAAPFNPLFSSTTQTLTPANSNSWVEFDFVPAPPFNNILFEFNEFLVAITQESGDDYQLGASRQFVDTNEVFVNFDQGDGWEKMYASSFGANNLFIDLITLPAPTSVRPFIGGNAELEIYPNPANGTITLESTDFIGETYVRITDMTGRVVYTKTLGEINTTTLDLSSLRGGSYIIHLNSADKAAFQRIILE